MGDETGGSSSLRREIEMRGRNEEEGGKQEARLRDRRRTTWKTGGVSGKLATERMLALLRICLKI